MRRPRVADRRKRFYVYVIRDPRLGNRNCPRYVGKGQRGRAFEHTRRTSHNIVLARMIAKCRRLGLEPPLKIVAWFKTEQEAFLHEIKLIARYGRLSRRAGTGTLYNLTNGGDGVSGFTLTNQQRSKHRKAIRRFRSSEQGKLAAQAHAKRLRALFADPKFKKRYIESRADPAFRKRMAAAIKRREADKEWRKRRAAMLRQRHADPAYRKRLAASLRRRNSDPVFLEMLRKAIKIRQATPQYRKRHAEATSKVMRAKWRDPVWRAQRVKERLKLVATQKFRKRLKAAIRRREADPEFRRRRAEGARRRVFTPEYRRRMAEVARAQSANPKSRKQHRDGIRRREADPKFRKRRNAAVRRLRKDPEWRERLMAGIRRRDARLRAQKKGAA